MQDDDIFDDLLEAIKDSGKLVAYQEWDSGAPGIGTGVVSVYKYQGQFYVTGENNAPFHGPYPTEQAAVDAYSIDVINEATVCIWEIDAWAVYHRDQDGDPEELEES